MGEGANGEDGLAEKIAAQYDYWNSLLLSVGNESVNFSLEKSESLLEFPTISRWLHCFVADSLHTESM